MKTELTVAKNMASCRFYRDPLRKVDFILSETGRYQLCIDSIMWCGVIREMKLGRKSIIGGK